MEGGLTITIGEAPLLLTPEILNWVADPIIAAITFGVVGLYYIKGSEPALGSILYMVFYAVHIGLLYLLLNIYPIIWLMIVVAVIYIALHITILVIKTVYKIKFMERGEIAMVKFEKEYQEFMVKLADKVNEVQKDLANLSPETQSRVLQDARYIAIMQLFGPQNR